MAPVPIPVKYICNETDEIVDVTEVTAAMFHIAEEYFDLAGTAPGDFVVDFPGAGSKVIKKQDLLEEFTIVD